MTEHLDAIRLQQIAVNSPDQKVRRWVPVMCWTIDERCLRPVCHWTLEATPNRSDLSLSA
jgi:hypothetical protein